MALTTVTVRRRVLSNNIVTNFPAAASETDCIETTNILIATPSVCYAGSDVDTAVNSKLIVKGVSNTEYSVVTLYVTQTVAQIAALT